jgi:aryl-alcohol dehydrogenase-like predicted oxidoreductase
MMTRVLGPSGIEVSALGLGCWAIGGPFRDQDGWMGYGAVDDAESVRAVRRALDLDITFFDTGGVYGCGHSERVLGRALSGRRERVVIAGKFGYTFDENERRVTGTDATPAGIRRACGDSLRRLGRDVIDLYQFHLHDYPLDRAVEVRQTLEGLVAEGKVRCFAWCTEDPQRVRLFAESPHCAAAPQLFNVLENSQALLKLCEHLGLAVIARRPLGMGLLTGKFTADSTFAENDMRRRFGWDFRAGKQARQLQQLEALQEVLTRDGRSVAQGALGYILAKSPVAIPIPGFKTREQVDENAATLLYGPLSDDQVSEIDGLLRRPAGANR